MNEIAEALFGIYFKEDEEKNDELLLARMKERQEEKSVVKKEESVVVEEEEETTWLYAYLNGEKVISITGYDEKALQIVAEDFKEEIQMQQEDDRNYGLLFYRCGYDGKAQTETREFYRAEYGVDVF